MPTTNTTALEALTDDLIDSLALEWGHRSTGISGNGIPCRTWEFSEARLRSFARAITALESSAPSAAEPVPTGAILNGRTYADRLEQTGLECIAGPLTLCNDWVEFRRCFEHLADWASTATARDALDTAGNRNPEARYAGYRGDAALDRYTTDEHAAWEEGRRARVAPAPSAASEREALTDELVTAWLSDLTCCGTVDSVVAGPKLAARIRAALHSTGKPGVEVATPNGWDLTRIDESNRIEVMGPDRYPLEVSRNGATLQERVLFGLADAILRAAPADAPVAEPVAWAVYWGLPPTRKNSVHFERASAEEAAATVKSDTEIRPLYDRPAAPASAEPVAAQSRFQGSNEWSQCTIEHHRMVQAAPHEWKGYETRALYALAPDGVKDAALREAANELEIAAFHIDGTRPGDVAPNVIESTGAADTAILAARRARAALSQGGGA